MLSETMTEKVVVAFLENVDWLGQDLPEQVHGCTEGELRRQLTIMRDVNNIEATDADCAYLAGRLREIVRHPGA